MPCKVSGPAHADRGVARHRVVPRPLRHPRSAHRAGGPTQSTRTAAHEDGSWVGRRSRRTGARTECTYYLDGIWSSVNSPRGSVIHVYVWPDVIYTCQLLGRGHVCVRARKRARRLHRLIWVRLVPQLRATRLGVPQGNRSSTGMSGVRSGSTTGSSHRHRSRSPNCGSACAAPPASAAPGPLPGRPRSLPPSKSGGSPTTASPTSLTTRCGRSAISTHASRGWLPTLLATRSRGCGAVRCSLVRQSRGAQSVRRAARVWAVLTALRRSRFWGEGGGAAAAVLLGEYGPHGREIIEVLPPDEAYLFRGLKRTGDRNVPAGQLTFRVPHQSPAIEVTPAGTIVRCVAAGAEHVCGVNVCTLTRGQPPRAVWVSCKRQVPRRGPGCGDGACQLRVRRGRSLAHPQRLHAVLLSVAACLHHPVRAAGSL